MWPEFFPTAVLLICLFGMASPAFSSPGENAPAGNSDTFKLDPDNYGFWENVHSQEQFDDWRKEILAFYRDVISLPSSFEALPLDTVYTETIRINENVTRHRIEYNTTDGLKVPAYLFVPKTDKPVPAVIVYHGHGKGKITSAEGVGTNENALARYLAETMGYVALAPDSRSFGEFNIPKEVNHQGYYYDLILRHQLYMAKLMQDGYQDMALLRSIPQVDYKRIGAAGISMGSWRALNQAVLQEDIGAAVVAGLYIPWEYLFSGRHCKCQHIPRLAEKMKMEDLAATVFPRDLMVQWGEADGYFQHDAQGLMDRTRKIAGFIGYQDHFFTDIHPGMGHQFSNPNIARFFLKALGPGAWAAEISE